VTALHVDHLVLAARTLDEGAAWCERMLGIVPGPGGQHPLMGTHNRLFSIASDAFADAYFEVIAIDPAAPPPGRARWFALDTLDLSRGPRLVAFVARTDRLDAALARLRDAGADAGRALEASRETPTGRLAWRVAVRDDGAVLAGGALPTLIEWRGRHPAASMPRSEGVNEPGVPEQRARTRPIKAQSAAIARAMASICNAEWPCSGVMSGHVGFVRTFSGVALRSLVLRGVPPACAAALAFAPEQAVRFDDGPARTPALEARLDTPRGPVNLASL
jgi:hypothetical protein